MSFKRNPVYRRSIYPWYDTELACVLTIFFLSFILFFGVVGISVASEKYEYHYYLWVPILITVLSGGVILSNAIRLMIKMYRRFTERMTRRGIDLKQDQ